MNRRLAAACLAAVAAALVLPPVVSAASAPEVHAVSEARDPGTGRVVLVLTGKSLTKFTSWLLTGPGGAPPLDPPEVLLRGKAAVLLRLPEGIGHGDFEVRAVAGAGEPAVLPVAIHAGGPWTETGEDVVRPGGRVGVGTKAPAATLHVEGPDGALFGGKLENGGAPASGEGTRMTWHPAKAAFRAGRAEGSEWDDGNTGLFSMAAGSGATASGKASVSLGEGTEALGNASVALGSGCTAYGDAAFVAGSKCSAKYAGSVALGAAASATGSAAVALGEGTIAQAMGSVALGRYNNPSGEPETWTGTDPLLVVGNGKGDGSRSDALVLTQDGNLQIAGALSEKSDARQKTAVRPLSGVLPRLAALRAVTYEFREGAGPRGRQVGLLAQEVRAAFPELVAEDGSGTLSVAYGKFAAVLLEAVREQQSALDAREREIAALREELARARASLEERLARLEGEGPR